MNKLFSELESTKCFTNLNAYNKIYSLILDCFFVLDNCSSDNKSIFNIILDTKDNCFNLLNNLAIGYNKYHKEDKLCFYNLSRDCLSKIQSQLILLNSFNIIDYEKTLFLIRELQDKLKLFNGTIRKIENLNPQK